MTKSEVMADKKSEFDFDLKINKYRLDDECLSHASRYAYYGEKCAEAKSALSEAKDNLELVISEVNTRIRDTLANAGQKSTEAMINALIPLDEEVKKARSLYKLDLDLGYEKRTIVSSIKAFYKPEELEGRRIIVVVNLKPAKMCGILSNGMLLAAESGTHGQPDEKISLLAPAEDSPLGSRVH